MSNVITGVTAKFKAAGSKAVLSEVASVERAVDKAAATSKIAAKNSGVQAAAEVSLAEAIRKRSGAADESLKKTEDMFKATDRVAGIIGKVTAAVGIFALAMGGLKAAYEAITGATKKAIQKQKEYQQALKDTERRMKLLAAASNTFTGLTGLDVRDISGSDRRRGDVLTLEIERVREGVDRSVLEAADAQQELNNLLRSSQQKADALIDRINARKATSAEVLSASGPDPKEVAALEARIKDAEDKIRSAGANLSDLETERDSLVASIRERADVDGGEGNGGSGSSGGGGPRRANPGGLSVDSVLAPSGGAVDLSGLFGPGDGDDLGLELAEILRDAPGFDADTLLEEIGAVDDGFARLVQSITGSVGEIATQMGAAGKQIQDGVGKAGADMEAFTLGIQSQAVATAYQLAVMGGSLQDVVASLSLGIGQQAAVKLPFTIAEALSAEAVTFGIPNPWSTKLWTAAGIYGGLAIGGGIAGVALGGGRGAGGGGGGLSPRAFAPSNASAPSSGGQRSEIYVSVETGLMTDTWADVGARVIGGIQATERIMGAPQIPARTIRRGRR